MLYRPNVHNLQVGIVVLYINMNKRRTISLGISLDDNIRPVCN